MIFGYLKANALLRLMRYENVFKTLTTSALYISLLPNIEYCKLHRVCELAYCDYFQNKLI